MVMGNEIKVLVCPNCGFQGEIWKDFTESYPTCFTCRECGSEHIMSEILRNMEAIGEIPTARELTERKIRTMISLHKELGWLLEQFNHHDDAWDFRMAEVSKVIDDMSEVINEGG